MKHVMLDGGEFETGLQNFTCNFVAYKDRKLWDIATVTILLNIIMAATPAHVTAEAIITDMKVVKVPVNFWLPPYPSSC